MWLLAVGCLAPPLPLGDLSDTACGDGSPFFFLDGDRDGYGDPSRTLGGCDDASRYVLNDGDCDDDDAAVHPDADESCDGRDEDCDGEEDDGACDSAADTARETGGDTGAPGDSGPDTGPVDRDGDGAPVAADCDDDDPEVHPGAEEVCGNGVDDDCTPGGCTLSGDLGLPSEGALLEGDTGVDALGYHIAMADDADGDGAAEVLVSAHLADGYLGAAYLFEGMIPTALEDARAVISGTTANGMLGAASFAGGDLTGDGREDLLVGEWGGAGTTYIFPVDVAGSSTPSDATATLEAAWFDMTGATTACAFDRTGAGSASVLVPAPSHLVDGDPVGAVYVEDGPFSGTHILGTAGVVIRGETPGDDFAWAAENAGDFDGDGLEDLLVTGLIDDWDDGDGTDGVTATVFLTPIDGDRVASDGELVITSARRVGRNVFVSGVGPGDLDGDGRDDVVLGDATTDDGIGAVYVLLGTPTPLATAISDADVVLLGDESVGEVGAGYGVAAPGDVDGDGFLDLLVGGSGGVAWLVAGPIGSGTLTDSRARIYSDANVFGLAGGADLGGDGYPDFAFGGYSGGGGLGRVWFLEGTGE